MPAIMDGGKKKRKPSAYNNFVKKYMKDHKKDGHPVTELISKAAKEWNKLTDAEKLKFK